jgi:TfoX/Sxy family transcriptional regulator of competence genes
MKYPPVGSKEKYARLVKSLIKNSSVSQPIGKKGFGSSGLYTGNKLFAFLSHKNQLILKMPKKRVDELVSQGDGMYWSPRRDGRVMKEWVVLKQSSKIRWVPLAKEAMSFVSSVRYQGES